MDAYLGIVSRREVRDYAARPLEPEVEHRILDAGRMAGSAKNRQPWTFLVVRDDRAIEEVAESVFEPGNVRGAAFVVAVVMDGGAGIDAGRAVQNMLLAAHAQGVGSCPNGISDRVGLVRALRLGEEAKVAAVLTFGYPAKPRDPARRSADEWVARANRKPYDDVVREL
ncbi:MAG TPA: nitroreductase family protein [Solirubrobacteraceae bacterium]|nr:nitroreductase family protein [Solirubrobacteraceae bacterium]